jgi:hypothetical protein
LTQVAGVLFEGVWRDSFNFIEAKSFFFSVKVGEAVVRLIGRKKERVLPVWWPALGLQCTVWLVAVVEQPPVPQTLEE